MHEFETDQARQLCDQLARLLVKERSLNEFLEVALPRVATALDASEVALVDYYEQTERFALLHMEGLGTDIYEFQKRQEELDLRKALKETDPFHPGGARDRLVLPLRFSETLEAVLFLESDHALELTPARRECARVASRLLGLLMSSSRLAVNRRFHFEASDLQRAREIQLSFLPKTYPSSEHCQVHGMNRSSAWVGGDYVDCFRRRPGSLQAILADACGHGLAAALIMSNFRGLLQAQLASGIDYSSLFNQLNESVHFEADFIQYLTGVFLDLDERSGRLRYLNAGHFDPLVVSSSGTRSLPGGGPPLGMFKSSSYSLQETQLERGDVLVLFTDGLVEIENEQEQQFGQTRIIEAVGHSSHTALPDLAARAIQEATDFAGAGGLEDDVTLLLLRLGGSLANTRVAES